MRVIRTIAEVRKLIRNLRSERDRGNAGVGLIPTMGYLHAGHMSLVREAKSRRDWTMVSIFVNPLQFGPNEDYARYPRDTERDLRLLEEEGVDALFMPDVEEMYPQKVMTTVSVAGITERLCGKTRPGHFDGVATVVSKLFHILQPDRAYFSVKDAQQVAVIGKMCDDLNIPVQIVACPIIREPDGLAMSSRNVNLTPQQRELAPVLNRALRMAQALVQANTPELTADQLRQEVVHILHETGQADIDYVEVLTYPRLEQIPEQTHVRDVLTSQRVIIALAVYFGKTRLIDNVILEGHDR